MKWQIAVIALVVVYFAAVAVAQEQFQPNNAFELLDAVTSSDHAVHQSDSVLGAEEEPESLVRNRRQYGYGGGYGRRYGGYGGYGGGYRRGYGGYGGYRRGYGGYGYGR